MEEDREEQGSEDGFYLRWRESLVGGRLIKSVEGGIEAGHDVLVVDLRV